jgi:hypothetical protein
MHFLIIINNIFSIQNVYPSKHFIKVGQVYIIYINIMFMKLVRLNEIILKIKYINIQWEVTSNDLLISPPYTTWS